MNVEMKEQVYDGDVRLFQFYHPHRLASIVPLFIFLVQGLLESVVRTIKYFAKLGNILVLRSEEFASYALEEDRRSIWVQVLRRYGSCFGIVMAYGGAFGLIPEAVQGSRFISSEIAAVVCISHGESNNQPLLPPKLGFSDDPQYDIPLVSISDVAIRSELLNARIQQVLQGTLKAQCLDWVWQFEQTDRLFLPLSSKLADKNREKWEATPSVGAVIEGSNFLPMKLMLDGHYEHSPDAVLQNYPNVGLIIDLSGDKDSYDRSRFVRDGPFDNASVVYYRSIPLASKSVPSNQDIFKFLQVVDEYNCLLSSRNEDRLIVVHCHYGYNRTGLLICAYLIERLGWSVDEALAAFAKARFPGIKHQNYLDKLYLRYIDEK